MKRFAPFHVALGTLTPGSAEVHRIREQALALSLGGHDPMLFLTEAFPSGPRVETVIVSGGGPLGLFGSQALRREILSAAGGRVPSCLHAHGAASIRAAHKIAREIGVPLIGDISDGPKAAQRDENVFSLPTRLVTPVASLARRLTAAAARPGAVVHLPGALDGDDLPPAPPVPFRLPPESELLLVYAALDDGQPDALLPVLDAALASRPGLHLVILGEPIGATFMKAVSAHRMVPHVTFGGLPPLPAVARLYAEARAILVAIDDPSLIEAHALLAVASGVPIVSLETEDAKALFEDAARYVPAGETVALGRSLVEVVSRGRSAAAAVGTRFRRPALAARLERLYEDVAASRAEDGE